MSLTSGLFDDDANDARLIIRRASAWLLAVGGATGLWWYL